MRTPRRHAASLNREAARRTSRGRARGCSRGGYASGIYVSRPQTSGGEKKEMKREREERREGRNHRNDASDTLRDLKIKPSFYTLRKLGRFCLGLRGECEDRKTILFKFEAAKISEKLLKLLNLDKLNVFVCTYLRLN